MLIFVQKEDELKNSILCVFANKQDIEGAMTASEVANSLGKHIWVKNNFKLINWLPKISFKKNLGLPFLKNRKYQIFKTSAVKGTGLDEAMEW